MPQTENYYVFSMEDISEVSYEMCEEEDSPSHLLAQHKIKAGQVLGV